MSKRPTSRTDDRGQAYTLEGFISAMVVLMAVLFALQSVVITPTTGGAADRSVQAQLQQETQDALVVSAQGGNLSETVRNWNTTEERFNGTYEGVTAPNENRTYNTTEFADQSQLGAILEQRFAESGQSYNVELVYEKGTSGEFNTTYLVYQGSPSSNALTASYTVTLYDNQSPISGGRDDYPIPETSTTEIYNTVEVRVTVW